MVDFRRIGIASTFFVDPDPGTYRRLQQGEDQQQARRARWRVGDGGSRRVAPGHRPARCASRRRLDPHARVEQAGKRGGRIGRRRGSSPHCAARRSITTFSAVREGRAPSAAIARQPLASMGWAALVNDEPEPARGTRRRRRRREPPLQLRHDIQAYFAAISEQGAVPGAELGELQSRRRPSSPCARRWRDQDNRSRSWSPQRRASPSSVSLASCSQRPAHRVEKRTSERCSGIGVSA